MFHKPFPCLPKSSYPKINRQKYRKDTEPFIPCFRYLSYFPLEETKNFCSTIVTHFVVGDLCKKIRPQHHARPS